MRKAGYTGFGCPHELIRLREVVGGYVQGNVVDLDTEIALNATKLSHDKNLPMADAIIYTIAEKYQATLWTQDADFKGLPGVNYFSKQA